MFVSGYGLDSSACFAGHFIGPDWPVLGHRFECPLRNLNLEAWWYSWREPAQQQGLPCVNSKSTTAIEKIKQGLTKKTKNNTYSTSQMIPSYGKLTWYGIFPICTFLSWVDDFQLPWNGGILVIGTTGRDNSWPPVFVACLFDHRSFCLGLKSTHGHSTPQRVDPVQRYATHSNCSWSLRTLESSRSLRASNCIRLGVGWIFLAEKHQPERWDKHIKKGTRNYAMDDLVDPTWNSAELEIVLLGLH